MLNDAGDSIARSEQHAAHAIIETGLEVDGQPGILARYAS
jgi:hypothetical protein